MSATIRKLLAEVREQLDSSRVVHASTIGDRLENLKIDELIKRIDKTLKAGKARTP